MADVGGNRMMTPLREDCVRIRRDPDAGCLLLESETVLPAPREEVFGFFSDAFQLERITPPWLKFRVLTPPPIEIRKGTLIDYRLRLNGIPIRWRTEISQWEPQQSFVDRQLKGPYLLWEHRHTFRDHESGTWMRDEVRYRVPGGRIVHRLFVRRRLLAIFEYRLRRMHSIFTGRGSSGPDTEQS